MRFAWIVLALGPGVEAHASPPAIATGVGSATVEPLWSGGPRGERLTQYAVDPHVHTRFSGDARGSLRQIKAAAAKRGLDAVVITDHGSVRTRDAIRRANRKGGVRLIPGAEAAVKGAHVGLWNLSGLPGRRRGAARSGRLDLLRRVARRFPDSLSVLNHPHWQRIGAGYFARPWFDPQGKGPRFDAVELWNGKLPLRRKTPAMILRWEHMLARGARLPIVAASDAHRPSEVGRVFTVVLARSLAAEDLVDAVRHGRTYLSDGPRLAMALDGVGPGDVLRRPDRGESAFRIRGRVPAQRRLRVFVGRTKVFDGDVGPGRFERSLPVDAFEDTWVRAELLHPSRRSGGRRALSAVTSPIYVDVAPYEDFWRPLPATWRDRPSSDRIARR